MALFYFKYVFHTYNCIQYKEVSIFSMFIYISVLKEDQVEEHQIEKIRKAFPTKEVKKQIEKWFERRSKE